MEYEIFKKQRDEQKRARVSTVHGEIQTPVFMNVGTVAAIKRCCINNGFKGNPYTGRAVQYVSSSCKNGR